MTESKVTTIAGLVLILLIVLAFLAFVFYKVFGLPIQTEHEKLLLKRGISAPARVISMEAGGMMEDQNQKMRYKLEIQPEGKAPYTVEVTTFVPKYKLLDLNIGSDITVKYDPKNPADVVIVQ